MSMSLMSLSHPKLLATAIFELSIDCGTHRGSFQSFGTLVEVIIGVLELAEDILENCLAH